MNSQILKKYIPYALAAAAGYAAITALDVSQVYAESKRLNQANSSGELYKMRAAALGNMQIVSGVASGLLALAAGFTARGGFKGIAVPAIVGAAVGFLASRQIERA